MLVPGPSLLQTTWKKEAVIASFLQIRPISGGQSKIFREWWVGRVYDNTIIACSNNINDASCYCYNFLNSIVLFREVLLNCKIWQKFHAKLTQIFSILQVLRTFHMEKFEVRKDKSPFPWNWQVPKVASWSGVMSWKMNRLLNHLLILMHCRLVGIGWYSGI